MSERRIDCVGSVGHGILIKWFDRSFMFDIPLAKFLCHKLGPNWLPFYFDKVSNLHSGENKHHLPCGREISMNFVWRTSEVIKIGGSFTVTGIT